MADPHVVTVVVEGQEVDGWLSGSIESSILTPADSFTLRVPFSSEKWRTLRRGARITIAIDRTVMLDGFIDKRHRRGMDRVLEISGRDRVGRLVTESAPANNYTGMSELEAIKRLVSPWFPESGVTFSNARNRQLRVGKGRRIAGAGEPVVTINVRVPRKGTVHPGQTRWQIIHEIASRSGHIVFSSADGKEIIVGKPNFSQDPEYLLCLPGAGSTTPATVLDLEVIEDDGDRYSLIMCGGVGGQSDTNYGKNGSANMGVVFDNPFNTIDGTGRDFLYPNRMYMPERSFASFGDAQRVAAAEQARRDLKRHQVRAVVADLGQEVNGSFRFFATDTVARVIDEDMPIDDTYWIHTVSYNFDRDTGDKSTLHMVPTGTEVIL